MNRASGQAYPAVSPLPKRAVDYVLSRYLEAALAEADYDKLDDGTFAGRISLCPGGVAFGGTLEACRRDLRSTLEDWLLLGLKLGHPLPIPAGINLNEVPSDAPMDPV